MEVIVATAPGGMRPAAGGGWCAGGGIGAGADGGSRSGVSCHGDGAAEEAEGHSAGRGWPLEPGAGCCWRRLAEEEVPALLEVQHRWWRRTAIYVCAY